MRKVIAFSHISTDGFFTDSQGDMSWAHQGFEDQEYQDFVKNNTKGESTFLYGRITYELMARYWPTPQALKDNPLVAKKMNETEKLVFSKTLASVSWENTKLYKGNLIAEVQSLKQEIGNPIVIFGSGKIVSQLAGAGLVDEYQFVLDPIALGSGRTLFEGIKKNEI